MTTETATPQRWTTCSCPDGAHRDPQAATRAHADREFADIIARHTGRHVIDLAELAEMAA